MPAGPRRFAQVSLGLLLTVAVACSDNTDGSSGTGTSAGTSGQGDTAGSKGSRTASGGGTTSSGGTGGVTSGGVHSTSTSASGGTQTGGTQGGSSGSQNESGGKAGTGGNNSASSGLGGTTATGGSQGGTNASGTGGRSGGATGGTSASSSATGGSTGGATTGGSSGSGGNGGAYNPCPAAGTECLVLPLGDSITEGFGASGNVGGYRLEIFRQAVANNKSIKFVGAMANGPTTLAGKTFPRNHEGHGGFTISGGNGSSGIGGNITDRAMTNYKPHIVLLMIGTNDINGNIDVAGAPTRLKNLINSIVTASPTTLVVVASIIPIENTGNQKVKDYNKSVKSVADELAGGGKHVVFLDNYAAFTADASFRSKWMADYLHPNDTGYNVLGQSWYGVIGPLLR